MSHFTVLVIHKPGEGLSDILEPYNENRDVEPYKQRIELDDVGKAIAFYAENPDLREEVTDEQVAAAQGKVTTWREGAISQLDGQLACLKAYNGSEAGYDDEGFFNWSTYNPDSKWDWWQLGGRWTGYFDIKPECDGTDGIQVGSPGVLTDPNDNPLKADQAPKRCIDIEGMRRRKAEAAGAEWDAVHAVIDAHPEAVPWRVFADQAASDVELADTTEAKQACWQKAREGYAAQPRVKAFREARDGFYDRLEDYEVPRKVYVARAEAGAIPGYATIVDGQWMAPGEMGWWGISSDDDSTRAGYWEVVNGFIDKADDDMIFSVVDCHI